jgi:hypothetical protein
MVESKYAKVAVLNSTFEIDKRYQIVEAGATSARNA